RCDVIAYNRNTLYGELISPSMTFSVVSELIEKDEYQMKLVFVGSAGVGKTCLIRRLFTNQISAETAATIGVQAFASDASRVHTCSHKASVGTLPEAAGGSHWLADCTCNTKVHALELRQQA
ncbi:hypothetical protein VaNZ11_005221, partial [Volvox africanus]